MKRLNLVIIMGLLAAMFALSCSKEASSTAKFIFKPAPKTGVVANVAGVEITEDEFLDGIKSEVFEAEKKLYDLKFNHLKSIIIQKLAESESGSMTSEEYIQKKIVGAVKPTKKQIDDFVKERNIPKEHLNDQLLARIESFLAKDLQTRALDTWLAKKTNKSKVEIYLSQPQRPYFDIALGAAPVTGSSSAKVTLIEFSDFECPFCAKGAKVVNDLKKKYGDKLQVAFKHYPLPFHKRAKAAANASMCAKEQGDALFWKMHDLLFENQKDLSDEGLKGLAKKAGVKDAAQFETCLSSNKYDSQIESDIAEGKKYEVQSTPTFFINGRLLSGAQHLEVFVEEIEKYL